jgi:hypothetical protein
MPQNLCYKLLSFSMVFFWGGEGGSLTYVLWGWKQFFMLDDIGRKNAWRCSLWLFWRMSCFSLCFASFRKLQSNNKSKSLWLGGWWRLLRISRVTKFGKQRSCVLCGFEGRECLIIQDLRIHPMHLFLVVVHMGL